MFKVEYAGSYQAGAAEAAVSLYLKKVLPPIPKICYIRNMLKV